MPNVWDSFATIYVLCCVHGTGYNLVRNRITCNARVSVLACTKTKKRGIHACKRTRIRKCPVINLIHTVC